MQDIALQSRQDIMQGNIQGIGRDYARHDASHCMQQYAWVTGQNGIAQNGTDKTVSIFVDVYSIELNLYLVTTSHK